MRKFPVNFILSLSRWLRGLALAGLTVAVLAGCASGPPLPPASKTARIPAYNRPYTVNGTTYYPLPSAIGYRERGMASWYGVESGNRTSMGTPFTGRDLTAAHRTLPLPTRAKITNLANGRSIEVLINDRGPFRKGRLIDLSKAAAQKLGLSHLAPVIVEAADN